MGFRCVILVDAGVAIPLQSHCWGVAFRYYETLRNDNGIQSVCVLGMV